MHMSPRLSADKATCVGPRHAEAPTKVRKRRPCCSACAEFLHLGGGQLGVALSLATSESIRPSPGSVPVASRTPIGSYVCRVTLAARKPLRVRLWQRAPLRRGVAHVVLVCPEEEVVRPHAGRVVAPVAHEQAGRDRSDLKRVHDAVGVDDAPVNAHRPVTVSRARARPVPAAVGLADPGPYPLGHRALHEPTLRYNTDTGASGRRAFRSSSQESCHATRAHRQFGCAGGCSSRPSNSPPTGAVFPSSR